MKRTYVVPLALMLLAGIAVASPLCEDGGGLDSYIANYNGIGNACQIGDKLFYNFSVSNSIDPTSVVILPDPGDGITNPGLAFSSGSFSVDPGESLDGTIQYSVATMSGSAVIEDYSLSIAVGNYDTFAAGTAVVTETFTNPVGTSLTTSFGPYAATNPTAHIAFSPFINGTTVTTRIQLFDPASSTDSVETSYIQEHFSEQLPEPGVTLLIGSGLLLLGFRRKTVIC